MIRLTDSFLQTAGVGGMRHNSVLLNWPQEWTTSHDWDVSHRKTWKNVLPRSSGTSSSCSCACQSRRRFINVIRASAAAHCAIIVTKGAENYPKNQDRVHGSIDVW